MKRDTAAVSSKEQSNVGSKDFGFNETYDRINS
jgi:hypothetical protein